MLAITEKFNRTTHGYCFPPDTIQKLKIMETMHFFHWTEEINDLQSYLDEVEGFIDGERKIEANIITSTYIYNDRCFAVINTSFLNFTKKCKSYYKNKINHYKKQIIYRTIHGKFPLFKHPGMKCHYYN